MATMLIRGGRVICPAQNLDGPADILVEGGKIARLGSLSGLAADTTIDAAGLIVSPGLIDMHVHLREPGYEEEETIASGAAAAVTGGFTSLCCMPNTDPPIDNEASAEFVFLQATRAGLCNVYPIGSITARRAGKELSEIGQLSRGRAVAFSDDGDCVKNADVMRRALQYAKMFDKPIIDHCEDKDLSGAGVMHSGYVSMVLGLPGIPAASEEVMVSRDIILAQMTGSQLHVAHVSAAGSVEMIRTAKARGVRVTAEATTHHLTLTDDSVRTFDPDFKMNPPLRTADDVAALRRGLLDGTIDAIVSDHAPHAVEKKQVEFSYAPFGVIGLESSLGVLSTELVHGGVLGWPQLIRLMTIGPAQVLRLDKGTLRPGADADITLIDPDKEWVIDVDAFRSKARNCPFRGRKVRGKAVCVIVGGEVKHP